MNSITFKLKVNTIQRWTLALIVLFLTLTFINWVQLYFAPHAFAGITDLCDNQYSYEAPTSSDSDFLVSNGYNIDGVSVTPKDPGQYTGLAQASIPYGLAGFQWQVSGNNMCNGTVLNPATTMIANWIFAIVLSGASIIKMLIMFAFSPVIAQLFLSNNFMSRFFTGAVSNFWADWGTLITLIGIGFCAWLLIKRGLKSSLGNFLWTAVAVALIVGAGTTGLIGNMATGFQAIRGDVTSSLTASLITDCEGDSSAAECIAGYVSSEIVYPTWAYGAAGDQYNQQPKYATTPNGKAFAQRVAGDTVYYKTEANMDKGGKMQGVKLPARGVIPTANSDGNPSVAEIMRWTQTYTSVESKAIQDGKIAGCSSLNAPEQDKLSKKAGEELCYYKWQIRSATLYGLANNGATTSAYHAASGNQAFTYRIQPAILAVPTSGTAFTGISVISGHMIFLQIEFIIQMAMVIFVLIYSVLRASPRAILDWAGGVGLNTIKVFLLGAMFAGVLIMWNLVKGAIDKATGVGGDGTAANAILSFALSSAGGFVILANMQALVFGIALLAMYLLYFKAIRKIASGNAALAAHNENSMGGKVQSAVGKTAMVSAAVGATAASGGTLGTTAMAGAKAAGQAARRGEVGILRGVSDGLSTGQSTAHQAANKVDNKERDLSTMTLLDNANTEGDQHYSKAETSLNSAKIAQANAENHEAAQAEDQTNADNYTQQADTLSHARDPQFERYVQRRSPQGKAAYEAMKAKEPELAKAKGETAKKQADLDTFLSNRDMSTTHQQITDGQGNVQTEVTDLSTGEKTYAPASTYDANLEEYKVFANPADKKQYDSLTQQRDNAAVDEADIQSQYDGLSETYNEEVQAERRNVMGMTSADIDKKYGAQSPEAKLLKDWRNDQHKAQQLRNTASYYTQSAASHGAQAVAARQSEATHSRAASTSFAKGAKAYEKAEKYNASVGQGQASKIGGVQPATAGTYAQKAVQHRADIESAAQQQWEQRSVKGGQQKTNPVATKTYNPRVGTTS